VIATRFHVQWNTLFTGSKQKLIVMLYLSYLFLSNKDSVRALVAGLFKSQQRAKQEPNRLAGLSIENAHVLWDSGDASPIKESQQKTVEDCQEARSAAFAHLTVIFAQGHISTEVASDFQWPSGHVPGPAGELPRPAWARGS
jgi:hypothetical protein